MIGVHPSRTSNFRAAAGLAAAGSLALSGSPADSDTDVRQASLGSDAQTLLGEGDMAAASGRRT